MPIAAVGQMVEPTDFERFVSEVEPKLRRALVAAFGPDRGIEATAEALAYGWEHWDRLQFMENPGGYLFRVGRSRTRPLRRPHRLLAQSPSEPTNSVEPGLAQALARLTTRQRTAVVLVHGFGWTLRDVAELSGIRVTTVQNHVERGLQKLREQLGVDDEQS